ncbi:MAG: HDOD domain-containing protein [Pseudomonadales bacterium]
MAEAPTKRIPNSLNGWQNALRQLVLPVDPHVTAAALQKLNSSSGNANNVAQILQDDPALSLLLMHEANTSLTQSGNETHSLSHTLSLLGFPRVATLIRRAPQYDKENFPYLREYQQQLTISHHAAHQAVAWAKQNPYWPQDEIFWAALFHRAPLWALWYHAGSQMHQLQQCRANSGGAAHASTERQVFGTNLQVLCATLSHHWHLPHFTQQSWQPSGRGNARQWIVLSRVIPEQSHIALEETPSLQRIASAPAFAIALANRLADETEWDWYSHRTLRLQHLLATALHKPLDATIALTHQLAIDATRRYRIEGTLNPAQQLFSFYRKTNTLGTNALETNALKIDPAATTPLLSSTATVVTRTSPKEAVPRIATQAEKITHALLDNAPADFVTVIERLQQQPESFNNLHEIMNLAVSTLCQSVNFERASASLLNRQSKELRTYYSSGSEDSPALKNFRHRLQRGDLFNKLLQKPLSVRLQPSNYTQIWPLLPGNFKRACGADQFFMMSVFAHKKPLALIYADKGISNRALSDQHYFLFKQMCSAVSHCLQQLSDR